MKGEDKRDNDDDDDDEDGDGDGDGDGDDESYSKNIFTVPVIEVDGWINERGYE